MLRPWKLRVSLRILCVKHSGPRRLCQSDITVQQQVRQPHRTAPADRKRRAWASVTEHQRGTPGCSLPRPYRRALWVETLIDIMHRPVSQIPGRETSTGRNRYSRQLRRNLADLILRLRTASAALTRLPRTEAAPIHRDIAPFQAADLVLGAQRGGMQRPGQPSADGAVRAPRRGDPLIPAALHQRGQDMLKHHPARHLTAVAAQRVPGAKLRERTTAALIKECAELDPAGSSRHDGTTGTGHLDNHGLW